MSFPVLLSPGHFTVIRYRLTERDRITWGGQEYAWKRTDERGHVMVDVKERREHEIGHDTFDRLLRSGEIVHEEDFYSRQVARRRERDITCYEDLDPEEREIMMHRLRWVEAFEILYVSGQAKKAPYGFEKAVGIIEERFKEEAREQDGGNTDRNAPGDRPLTGRSAPSWSQLGRWVRAYAKADGDPVVLLPETRRCGNRAPRLDPVVARFVHVTAQRYCAPSRPSVALLYERMGRQIRLYNGMYRRPRKLPDLDIPSVKALERAVTALDDFDKIAGRRGIDYARRYFMPVFEGPVVTRPLDRVEIDEWKISLQAVLERTEIFEKMSKDEKEAVKRMRCWVTVAIDYATRCIVGVSLSNQMPSATTALSCLRWIMEDKEPLRLAVGAKTPWPCRGRPVEVVTDAGSGFKSKRFEWALRSLGIDRGRPPGKHPNFRGTIERFFGTLETRLIARYDGRTFSGIEEKGDYDSEKFATLTVEELERAMIRFICDVYHRTPMAALGGLSPSQAWNRLIGDGVRPAPGADAMCRAFGTAFHRSVSARGVRVHGCFYRSAELMDAWEKNKNLEVDVFIDEGNLGRAVVRIERGHWTAVEADAKHYRGLDFDRHFREIGDLVSRGLPAFEGVTDPAESRTIMDEALADLDRTALLSRRRAGLFDHKKMDARIAAAKGRAEKMFTAMAEYRVPSPDISDPSTFVDLLDGMPIRANAPRLDMDDALYGKGLEELPEEPVGQEELEPEINGTEPTRTPKRRRRKSASASPRETGRPVASTPTRTPEPETPPADAKPAETRTEPTGTTGDRVRRHRLES
ncbi:Integrase, catalytic domain [Fulvimarina pelagi HTCC2506]|uniref:Integrase, catalytic domain n=1 Tax=Fulvimarina pelagi HTCC2506 TaxID=314231 RepID=Q0G268_9HYPH|nr:DDE-type integrase/transposase/recombinase [Fulvimarina pelagi]EAU41330.1 Integrase, catalytic domain [Fulvimarina pelagi HTCC2506]